jgi:shikimate kinase
MTASRPSPDAEMAEPETPDRPRLARLARPLVLVGLMGAGKTSVGKRLAALLGAGFVDSDAEIERAARMTIPEIFARFGEPEFRELERRVIARLVAAEPRVIATGGGAFVEPRTREAIREGATSVWLRAELDVLWDRVKDRPGRPLLAAPDPKAVLAELHARRAPAYAEADVTVESRRGVSHDTMARAIVAAVAEHDRARPGAAPTLREIAPQ